MIGVDVVIVVLVVLVAANVCSGCLSVSISRSVEFRHAQFSEHGDRLATRARGGCTCFMGDIVCAMSHVPPHVAQGIVLHVGYSGEVFISNESTLFDLLTIELVHVFHPPVI